MIVEDEGFRKHWALRLFGPHPHEPPPPTRAELVDALAKCDRQLEILSLGPLRSGNADVFRSEAAEVESVRAGLAQALAELGPESS